MNWAHVRLLWEFGASEGWLCRVYAVTERQIGVRSVGWDLAGREASMRNKDGGVLPVGRGGVWGPESSVEMWMDSLVAVGEPRIGGVGFPLAEMAEALHGVASGMPVGLACEAAGVDAGYAQGLRRGNPRLESLFRRARAMSARPLVERIMRSEDWKAAAWMLEKNMGREEFRAEAAPEKMVIEINVSRDEGIARERGVIDVTPGGGDAQVVPELPAKR